MFWKSLIKEFKVLQCLLQNWKKNRRRLRTLWWIVGYVDGGRESWIIGGIKIYRNFENLELWKKRIQKIRISVGFKRCGHPCSTRRSENI